jgi:hypothetical protein
VEVRSTLLLNSGDAGLSCLRLVVYWQWHELVQVVDGLMVWYRLRDLLPHMQPDYSMQRNRCRLVPLIHCHKTDSRVSFLPLARDHLINIVLIEAFGCTLDGRYLYSYAECAFFGISHLQI